MVVGEILTIDGYSWVISDKPNFDHLHSLQQLNNSGIIIKESRLLQIVFYALWLSFTTDNNVNHCGIKKIGTQFYGVILSKQANTYVESKQAEKT